MRSSQEYKDISIQEFTKAAEVYETDDAGVYKTCRKNYARLLEEVAKEPFEALLDAGCGTGPMANLLLEDHPQCSYTGLDLTPKMIEVARSKNLAGAQFVVGDCENLPFEPETFDVVICCESFHHYPNPQDFFNSVAKVLRPGGRLILHDYAAAGAVNWFINHIEMPLLNLIKHGDVAVHTEDELRAFCAAAGLAVETYLPQKGFKVMLVARKPLA